MGQSSSDNQMVDANLETFSIHINQFKVEHPAFEDLRQEFTNKFPRTTWHQILWTISKGVIAYKNDINYTSWKSAYNSIYGLKICAMIICSPPFCISMASIIICLFLLFMCIFLTATGTDKSIIYVWNGTYKMLSTPAIIIIIGSYVMTLIGIIILYFTSKSLKPLKDSYAQNMAKYISSNLMVLNNIYDKCVRFEMESIKINSSFIECKCGDCNLDLIGFIRVTILTQNITAIDNVIVMDALNFNTNSESSQYYAKRGEFMRVRTRSVYGDGGDLDCAYYPVGQFQGEEGIQTDVSIEISVADFPDIDICQ